jgi:tRNA pseudouridine13 synthase
LAWLHRNGRVFAVEDVEVEQPRCDAGEISPSGPLFGYRMAEPGGGPGQIEQRLLSEAGLARETFRGGGGQRIKGARRPLRICMEKLNVVEEEPPGTLLLEFGLPAGCYATAVLREINK